MGKERIERYFVTVQIPDGVSLTEMRWYIQEAIELWCKGKDPEDPIFDLKKVHVRKVKQGI